MPWFVIPLFLTASKTHSLTHIDLTNLPYPFPPGGGYNLPATPGHFRFCADINAATNPNVAVLFLGYTLAPHAHYPTQLTQGVELLRYLIKNLNRKPGNIMVGGDSAGANLTLGILSHLSHPHPSIAPLELEAPLKGIVLLAPWTSFDNEGWASVEYNKNKDTVNPSYANIWSGNFLGGKPRDKYNEPMTADPEWWRGLRAEEVLMVTGGDEILLDSIKAFCGKMKVDYNVFQNSLFFNPPNSPTITLLSSPHSQTENPAI